MAGRKKVETSAPNPVPCVQRAPAPRAGDDGALVKACVAGDDGAWRELVDRYGALVFSIARRYGLDRSASEDVFQDVFAILVRQLPRIRRGTGLPKWLITTTYRVCRQWVEQNPRVTLGLDSPEGSAPPPEAVAEWERRHLVGRALRRLGGRCEQMLVALYCGHRPASYEAVAKQLGIPVGSVGPTRARCLKKLMELLEELEGGEP